MLTQLATLLGPLRKMLLSSFRTSQDGLLSREKPASLSRAVCLSTGGLLDFRMAVCSLFAPFVWNEAWKVVVRLPWITSPSSNAISNGSKNILAAVAALATFQAANLVPRPGLSGPLSGLSSLVRKLSYDRNNQSSFSKPGFFPLKTSRLASTILRRKG